MGYGIVA